MIATATPFSFSSRSTFNCLLIRCRTFCVLASEDTQYLQLLTHQVQDVLRVSERRLFQARENVDRNEIRAACMHMLLKQRNQAVVTGRRKQILPFLNLT